MQNTQVNVFNAETTLKNFEAFEKMSEVFTKGKALPKGIENAPQLIMLMQAGSDLGLTITESMQSLAIINGRVTMYGPKIIDRVLSAGYRMKLTEEYGESIIERDSKKYTVLDGFCECTLTLGSGDDMQTWTERYTLSDAELAGLLGKDVREKYPKLMLRYRAIGQAVKFFCPQVLGGMSMYEEMRDHFGEAEGKSFERITPTSDLMDGFDTIVGKVTPKQEQEHIVDVTDMVDDASDDLEVIDTVPVEQDATDVVGEVVEEKIKPTEMGVGVIVTHKLLGDGTIEEMHGDNMLVKFHKSKAVKVIDKKQLEIS